MTIAEFLKQDMDGIVDEWVDFARTKVLASQNFSRENLADHARLLLLAIAEDIARWQDAQTSIEKSQGDGAGIAPDITRVARDHAAQRFRKASPSITWWRNSGPCGPRSYGDGRSN